MSNYVTGKCDGNFFSVIFHRFFLSSFHLSKLHDFFFCSKMKNSVELIWNQIWNQKKKKINWIRFMQTKRKTLLNSIWKTFFRAIIYLLLNQESWSSTSFLAWMLIYSICFCLLQLQSIESPWIKSNVSIFRVFSKQCLQPI